MRRPSSPLRNCLVEMRISSPAIAFGLANASHVARTKSSVSVTCAGSDNTSSDRAKTLDCVFDHRSQQTIAVTEVMLDDAPTQPGTFDDVPRAGS